MLVHMHLICFLCAMSQLPENVKTYVILAANVEDFRHIAKKFISQQVVEKFVDTLNEKNLNTHEHNSDNDDTTIAERYENRQGMDFVKDRQMNNEFSFKERPDEKYVTQTTEGYRFKIKSNPTTRHRIKIEANARVDDQTSKRPLHWNRQINFNGAIDVNNLNKKRIRPEDHLLYEKYDLSNTKDNNDDRVRISSNKENAPYSELQEYPDEKYARKRPKIEKNINDKRVETYNLLNTKVNNDDSVRVSSNRENNPYSALQESYPKEKYVRKRPRIEKNINDERVEKYDLSSTKDNNDDSVRVSYNNENTPYLQESYPNEQYVPKRHRILKKNEKRIETYDLSSIKDNNYDSVHVSNTKENTPYSVLQESYPKEKLVRKRPRMEKNINDKSIERLSNTKDNDYDNGRVSNDRENTHYSEYQVSYPNEKYVRKRPRMEKNINNKHIEKLSNTKDKNYDNGRVSSDNVNTHNSALQESYPNDKYVRKRPRIETNINDKSIERLSNTKANNYDNGHMSNNKENTHYSELQESYPNEKYVRKRPRMETNINDKRVDTQETNYSNENIKHNYKNVDNRDRYTSDKNGNTYNAKETFSENNDRYKTRDTQDKYRQITDERDEISKDTLNIKHKYDKPISRYREKSHIKDEINHNRPTDYNHNAQEIKWNEQENSRPDTYYKEMDRRQKNYDRNENTEASRVKRPKIVTMFPKLVRYSHQTPNYYLKDPNIAQRYNFNEPIPEADREPEKKMSKGNDLIINGKFTT